MPSAIVVCPSGLSGEVRSAKVRELRAFIDGVRKSFASSLTDLLTACWMRTEDLGVYAEPLRWTDVLAGDRLDAWRHVRKLTFGNDLDFEFQCDSGLCREMNPKLQGWGAKLDALEVKLLPDVSRELFRAGNRFPTSVAGVKVWFQLLTGALEAEVERRSRGKRLNLAESMAERVVEVEGVGTKRSDIAAWVDDLEAGDFARLNTTINDADCGIELGIDVQCEFCRRVVRMDVPFVENWTRLAKKAVSSTR